MAEPITHSGEPLELKATTFLEILAGEKRGQPGFERFYGAYKDEHHPWLSFDDGVLISNVQVTEAVLVPEGFRAPLPVVISSGMFSGDFGLSGGTFLGNFWIAGGTFEGDFRFSDGVFSGSFLIAAGAFLRSFQIRGGTFSGGFGISGGTFSGTFRLLDGVFSGDFGISGGTFLSGFRISGGRYLGTLEISGGTFSGGFKLSGGTFSGSFWVRGGRYLGTLEISGGKFSGVFEISSGTFSGGFLIADGTFSSGFWIRGGMFSGNLWIRGGAFPDSFKISSGTFSGTFWIAGGTFKKMLMESSRLLRFDTLEVSIEPAALPLLQVVKGEESFVLNTLRFRNVTLEETDVVQVNGVPINQLEFQNVLNYGNISLTGVSAAEAVPIGEVAVPPSALPQLRIQTSDLGKTTWIGCDFAAAELTIESAKLTEMFVTGTQFPKDLSPTMTAEQQRLGYGQLRKVYENRGDTTKANEYFAQQMNAYMKTLSWRNDFWEKLNLTFNELSTNHGQNWQQGLASTLLTAYCFFLVYLFAVFVGARSTFDFKGNPFSYFFEFISPVHNYDFMVPIKAVNDTARVIDSVSRIFIAYFIYQLVQAFRKHGKKGD
jgi:hypothetical protein